MPFQKFEKGKPVDKKGKPAAPPKKKKQPVGKPTRGFMSIA